MITMFNAMVHSFFRSGIIALLAAALGLLGACSALRFGYNQADELAFWWLDGYADFDNTQAFRVRQALTQWHTWHRRTQLPDYTALLVQVQAEAPEPVTAQRLCSWWDNARSRIDVALESAIPAAAELLLTLTPQQIEHIERRYGKFNAEFRQDYLQTDPAQRMKASVKRAVDRAETLYGRIDDAQRERIGRLVAQSPFDAELWFSERKARQQEALQMLRRLKADAAGADQAQAAVRAYIERMAHSPRAEYRRYAQTLVQYNCQFAAELHNATSTSQRQALGQRLKGWETDLRALSSSATP
ncbi:MAG: DUF6279 family lipoprotein [Burkholderiaceae bacterium]